MRFDVMTGPRTWTQVASLARTLEGAGGISGMVFTEQSQAPWMSIAIAAEAAPTLEFATGIAVAFARSPMVTAGLAWEIAENTQGRFRLGLGSQVKAHIERRYGADFDPPGPRLATTCWRSKPASGHSGGTKSSSPRPIPPAVPSPRRVESRAATPTATSRWTYQRLATG